jgi:hypothetical protein
MRHRPIGLLLAGVIVASTACSTDATVGTAPSSPSHEDADARAAALPLAPLGALAYTVTIDPLRENVLRFDAHTLVIPARAICDEGSSYGLGTWDDGCRIARDSITITALVRSTEGGIPRIDFLPELRFSPRQVVVLTMYVPNLTPALPVANILYCASQATETCVDEAAMDAEVQTYRNYPDSSLFRRIKHFSGYFVQE